MARQNLIFLPGFMCDARLFTPQLASLSTNDVNCKVGDLSRAGTIERMASQIIADAPPRFALAGLSMGAIVALEICRQAGERVSHLALMNATARADAAGSSRKAQLRRVAAGELDLVLREDLKPQYLAAQNRTHERLALLEQMGESLGEDVFVRQTMALCIRRAAFDILADISCPTLVIAGAEDRVCPLDRHEEIARAIDGADLLILPGCGHISTLECPEAVSDALRGLLARPSASAGQRQSPELKLVSRLD